MTSCANPTKKLAFIHIHKCAGTSITEAFLGGQDLNHPNWLFPQNSLEKSKKIMTKNNRFLDSNFSAPRHFRAMDMEVFLGKDVYESYYTFAVSRNPWDRLASWYFFLRDSHKKDQSIIARQTTMEDFIKFCVDKFYLPQHQWVTNPNGDVIVDDIIKLENLQERWTDLSARIFETPVKLPNVNKSPNTTAPPSNPFNHVRTETLEMFVDAYERDFDLLGYSKDLPAHRNQSSLYKSCEKIWTAEVAGNSNSNQLCKKHGVDDDFYMLYREANSAHFYSTFLKEQADNGGQEKLLALIEKNKNVQSINDELRRELKTGLATKEAKIRKLLSKISDDKKQEIGNGKEKLLALMDRNKSLQSRNHELRQALKSGLATKDKEIQKLRSQNSNDKKQNNDRKKAQILDLTKKNKSLQDKNHELRQKLKTDLASKEKEVQKLRFQISDFKKQSNNDRKEKLLSLMDKNKDLQDKNHELRKNLKTGLATKEAKIQKLLSNITKDKKAASSGAEKKLLGLMEKSESLRSQNHELRQKLKTDLASKEKEVQKLRVQISDYKKQSNSDRKEKLLSLMDKNKDLQNKNRELRKKLKTGLIAKEEKIQKLLSRFAEDT